MKTALREECIRLRCEDRLSLREIAERTGAGKGSISVWLRDYPLSEDEKSSRQKTAKRYVAPKKQVLPKKGFASHIGASNLKPTARGHVAEAVVQYRLAIHDIDTYVATSDCARSDFIVQTKKNRVAKIQVKSVMRGRHGLPMISLKRTFGHGKQARYLPGEFDFIIGVDLETDAVYVFSEHEVAHCAATISVCDDAHERWDKIINF